MADPALAMTAAAPSRYDGFDKMLLNGAWRHGSSGQFADDRNPYTNDVLVRIPLADERDLDDAFAAQPRRSPSGTPCCRANDPPSSGAPPRSWRSAVTRSSIG